MKGVGLSALALGLVVGMAVCGGAQGFPDVPPTWGLARPTAHTLRATELQIGLVSVLNTATLYVSFGLTNDLQIGILPIPALQEAFNVNGKYGFSLAPDVEMGIPIQYWYWAGLNGSYQLHVGAVVSSDVTPFLRLHAGLTIVTGRMCRWLGWPHSRWDCSQILLSTPHAILEFELAETARVLVEAEAMPLRVKTGLLVRLLDSIDLRATLILVPTVELQLGVEGRLVFGRREPGPRVR